MAEKIVSPGVFTTETDLSFLPAGIGEIGAVIIGPTKKGPAFIPTIIESIQDFDIKFGGIDSETYVPYTVQEYLRSAGRVTIIRILGTEAFEPAGAFTLKSGGNVVASLVPKAGATGLFEPNIAGFKSASDFTIQSGADASVGVSCSFDTTSDNYIEKVFGRDPFATTTGTTVGKKYYLYRFFATTASTDTTSSTVTTSSYSSTDGGVIGLTTNKSYGGASTPIIQSQTVAGTKYDLFQFKTLSDGTDANFNIKVQIQDLKRAGTIAGSEYGSFTVVVRRVNGFNYKGDWGSLDTDNRPEIVETFANCNLDPDSTNFITRKIGDRYAQCDDDGRITYKGDYPNKSKYLYVYHTAISDIESLPKELLPFGFKPLSSVISESGVPAPTYVTIQGDADTHNPKVPFGFDFTNVDNREHLWSIPDGAGTVGTAFSLEDQFGHPSASGVTLGGNFPSLSSSLSASDAPQNQLKFIVPFQGGYDGIAYNVKRNIGEDITATNLYGMDCDGATGGGTKAYLKALNTISNADEYDINMISIPGVIHSLHPLITNKAILVAEDRGDAFVVIDAVGYNEHTGKGAADAVASSTVTNLDSNFAATYWPWVKILDSNTNKPTWVPPGVVLPGVIANTDKVAHEWFAPAGLNRGGLTQVLEAEVRLTHEERDTLYEKRINPIATFPGEGVCIWGQKTLQGKPSALDRVNVRRLLIRVKKFIASASRFLVFEQNNPALRQRFLNIANPFLESVQQNAGLSAFKVVMDETNNTPDVVDRNQLVGQIFLQPTRTAEFIVLDFTVLPTGATFPE